MKTINLHPNKLPRSGFVQQSMKLTSLHDNPAIAVKMNERINRLFDERYWKVAGFYNTLHLIYGAICTALIGFGLPFFRTPRVSYRHTAIFYPYGSRWVLADVSHAF